MERFANKVSFCRRTAALSDELHELIVHFLRHRDTAPNIF
jgi:hypothetical protein